jgi:predicted acetyltransferase
MNIEIQRATAREKSVLRNLMELCQHDYSEYDGADVDDHGRFEYKYLDHYWTEPERHPFLVRVAGKLAGFVLVRAIPSPAGPASHAIAEFFILRKYRRQGVGRRVAQQIFDMFPGPWSVYQHKGNQPAQAFWRRVIAEYTAGAYTEEQDTSHEWPGPHQHFWSHAERPHHTV